MAVEARVTQSAIEILAPNPVQARVTQDAIEVLAPLPIEARVTQDALENSSVNTIPVRVTQSVIEIMKGAIDLSGIYFINPKITHDIYYGDPAVPGSKVDKKIPDPTIRLPLLGD